MTPLAEFPVKVPLIAGGHAIYTVTGWLDGYDLILKTEALTENVLSLSEDEAEMNRTAVFLVGEEHIRNTYRFKFFQN